jgi:hypothetical protein
LEGSNKRGWNKKNIIEWPASVELLLSRSYSRSISSAWWIEEEKFEELQKPFKRQLI